MHHACSVAIPLGVLCLLTVATTPGTPDATRVISVRQCGARGDGKHDDTHAFRKAVALAGRQGGTVVVPSVGPSKGYVLTGTVSVPAGVVVVGSPAGFGNNAWAAFPMPENLIVGAKIFARPSAGQYEGPRKQPLFALAGGSTMRGLWIFYDQQPWPSDEEFQNPSSPYYYPSFEVARKRFLREHVKPCGPTFYVTGPNVVIEDIVCDRYYDFFVQPHAGKTSVDRIYLYGYRAGFVYGECLDVNRLSRVHLVPNVGPACPGKVLPNTSYTWIYGIVASQPENVGVHVARSDGYVFSDLMFFGVHTAIRLGASCEYPVRDSVTGKDYYQEPGTQKPQGFQFPYTAQGPWGTLSGLMADQCVIGVHLVWPTPLTNRMTNVAVHTALKDGTFFPADDEASGRVGRQGAVVVEPTHVRSNNIGITPTLMITNFSVGSFSERERFADVAADAVEASGRVLLFGGDLSLEVTHAQINSPYTEGSTYAFGKAAASVFVRMRGLVRNGVPTEDLVLFRAPGRGQPEQAHTR